MYFKTNVTEELIGELLFVDQSTISRAISDLEEVITEVLEEFVPDLTEEMNGRVVVVDGSLCPAGPGPTRPSCTLASTRLRGTRTNSSAISPVIYCTYPSRYPAKPTMRNLWLSSV